MLRRMPEGPVRHHQTWVTTVGVPRERAQIWEHYILSLILEWGLLFDGLRAENLLSFELLARRLALIEKAFDLNADNPDFSIGDYMLSIVPHREGALREPAMEAFVARRLQEQAFMAKELRKATDVGLLDRAATRLRGRFGRGRGANNSSSSSSSSSSPTTTSAAAGGKGAKP